MASAGEPLVFLNFWATWCEPCKEEFPDLVRVEGEYRNKGIEFWAVSCDPEDDLQTKVPQFLAQYESGMRMFRIDLAEQETVINAVWPEWAGTLPATFIFRRSGERIFERTGQMAYQDFKEAIEEALKRKA